MVKTRKTIIGFAVFGLAIASLLYVQAQLYDPTKPLTVWDLSEGVASFILCPPSLVLAACIDCEPGGWNGLFVYSVIGALNAVLYGAIGAVVARVRNNRSNPQLLESKSR
jgi:hypothetical protein